MKTEVGSPEFWISQWKASLEGMACQTGRGYAGRDLWNRMAAEYGREAMRDSSRERETEGLVSTLEDRGLLRAGYRVLDIGCGAGGKAIAFAKRGAEVVALDFSEKMLERLRASVPAELAGGIQPVEADWEEVDLKKHGLEGSFDLVFASMTPAVQTPESFLKLHRASRRGCYFRGWAGRRKDFLLAELWRHLRNEPMPPMCGDIVVAFNLLYAMGLSPSIEFDEVAWEKHEPVERASEFLMTFFADVTDLGDDELGKLVDGYLMSVARDGQVVRRTAGRTGTMIWEVG